MTEVVAALIWDKEKFMICQRPTHKARGLLWEFVGGKVEPGGDQRAGAHPGVSGGAGRSFGGHAGGCAGSRLDIG